MAVLVNTHDEQQEHNLTAFLDDKNYDYKVNTNMFVTEKQAEEILNLITPQTENEAGARSWEEIRQELKSNVVTLVREAGIDIETPCYWYENQHIGLAGVLLKQIDNYFDLLSQNPLM